MFTIQELFQALDCHEVVARERAFTEAVIDSRLAAPGTLFVAIPGENTDGHRYIASAFANGAAAALIQRGVEGDFPVIDLREGRSDPIQLGDAPFCVLVEDTVKALQKIAAFHRASLPNMRVIGLTGSVGKTTTKEITAQVLSTRRNVLKTPGNMNNEIGLPLTLLKADDMTEIAVLEMGFYVPGEITLLCDIARPDVGIITNVGMVHASRAGSKEVIAAGKRELVESLTANGVAVLNYDDPYVKPMGEGSKARVIYYGLDSNADLWADQVESYGLEGIRFRVHYRGDSRVIRVPMIGRHSVLTALRAAAVGLNEGLFWDEIEQGLQGDQSLRMKVVKLPTGTTIVDDTYNASPESTLAALNLLADIQLESGGRKIAVLGDMLELGQYEREGHEMVGRRCAQVCDELIAVGPASKGIAAAALSEKMLDERVRWFVDAPEVIAYFKENIPNEKDVILVKGSRGMRMDRITDALEGLL